MDMTLEVGLAGPRSGGGEQPSHVSGAGAVPRRTGARRTRAPRRHIGPLAHPIAGIIRVFQDASLEASDGRQLVVISTEPASTGVRCFLDRLGDGPMWATPVRVVSSQPTVLNGARRHRIRLITEDGSQLDDYGPVVSGLVRTIPVRILEVTPSGCSMEIRGALDGETTAELEAPIGKSGYLDPVLIDRCTPVRGSRTVVRAWAEFRA